MLYLRVSSLSHSEFCDKRSKIETFMGSSHDYKGASNPKGPIAIGNRLHSQYSYMYRDFDSDLVLNRLERYLVRGAFQKQVGEDITVRGSFDNIRVIENGYDGMKYTVPLELKTIDKKYLWNREILAAMRQLQLYMWLVKDLLEETGFPMWKRGYLEIFSQHTGELLRRIPVDYDENIEEWIKEVVNKYKGLTKMVVPHYAYCKRCPVQVRSKCNWYELRKENEN